MLGLVFVKSIKGGNSYEALKNCSSVQIHELKGKSTINRIFY